MDFMVNKISSSRQAMEFAVADLVGECSRLNATVPYDSEAYDAANRARDALMFILCEGNERLAGRVHDIMMDNTYPSDDECGWGQDCSVEWAIKTAREWL